MNTPYSKVYDAIWALLEGSAEFIALFPEGNRIKYNSATDRHPQKQNQQTADTPEVMLVPMGGPINLQNTSSSTKVMQTYDLVVNTGDYRINEYIFPISWIVTCVAKAWCAQLTALLWRTQSFVKVVRISNNQIGESPERKSRGIKGWSTLISFEVEMHFDTASQLQITE